MVASNNGGRVTSPANTRDQHLPVLDGLRGIAIILVMLVHFDHLPRVDATMSESIARTVLDVGWSGVDLFFVLSGFLITRILLRTVHRKRYFRKFYIRRALRIFPLYYTYLFAILVVVPFAVPQLVRVLPGYADLLLVQGWYWTYLTNFHLVLAGAWTATPLHTAYFWSLAIEEQFYFVWPTLVFLSVRRGGVQRLCVVGLAASMVLRILLVVTGAPAVALTVLPLVGGDGLLLGAWLAAESERRQGLVHLRPAATLVAGFASAVFVVTVLLARGTGGEGYLTGSVGVPSVTLLFGAVLVLTLTAEPQEWVSKVLNGSRLRYVGKISYGLYVFHIPVGLAVAILLFPALKNGGELPRVLGTALPAEALVMVACAVAATTVAHLSWQLYERHFLALKERFAPQRLSKPRDEEAAVGLATAK